MTFPTLLFTVLLVIQCHQPAFSAQTPENFGFLQSDLTTGLNQTSHERFLASCGAGKYQYSKTGTCLTCDFGCETCTGLGPDKCSKCFANFTKSTDGLCKCYPQKLLQRSPPDCTNGAAAWDENLKKCYSCVAACPFAHYFDGTKLECLPCAYGCTHCFGGLNNQCLKCDSALGYSYDIPTQTCVVCGGTVNGENICSIPGGCSTATYWDENIASCGGACANSQIFTAFTNPSKRCHTCAPECSGGCFVGNDPTTCWNCMSGRTAIPTAENVNHPKGSVLNSFSCVDPATLPKNIFNAGSVKYYCRDECGLCPTNPEFCTLCKNPNALLFPGQRCVVTDKCPDGYIIQVNENKQRECVSSDAVAGELTAPGIANKVIGKYALPIAASASQVGNPGISSAAVRALLINTFGYIKFLRINYPTNLAKEFANNETQLFSLNFGIPFPAPWKKQADNYLPPERYAKYGVDGLFVVTFWSYGCTAVIVFALTALVLWVYKKGTVNSPRCKRLFKVLADFFAWNYVAGFFISTVGDLSFSGIVEFQSLNFKNSSAIMIVSFILNIVVMIALVLSYFLVFIPKLRFIYKDIKQTESMAKQEEAPTFRRSETLDQFKVLFDEFKKDSPVKISFLLVLILRIVLFNLFVTLLYDFPVVQVGLLIFLNIFMSLYIIIFKPYDVTRKNVEMAFYEILLLLINVGVLILALQTDGSGPSIDPELLGTIIIYTNLLLIVGSLVFTGLELLSIFREEVYRFCKFVKNLFCPGKKGKVVPMNDESPKKTPRQIEENQPLTESGGESPFEKAKFDKL